MSRRLMASVLFGLGLLVVTATGQPPAGGGDAKIPPAPKKAVDPLDALIGAALAHDPDVKVANAKLQLADAELARVRQQVAQKVVALDSAIREQKKAVATAEQGIRVVDLAYKEKQIEFVPVRQAREKLETAQAKLAQLETELKLLTGSGVRIAAAVGGDDLQLVHFTATWGAACQACHQSTKEGLRIHAFEALMAAGLHQPVKGPIADRIRAALDKPIKLGAKDAKVTLEQALETFKKEAGLDVPVRVDAKVGPIVSLGEELPVGAWLQLYADGTRDTRILVREYGLLVTNTGLNPPDALSVFDFWKQKPDKKVEKDQP